MDSIRADRSVQFRLQPPSTFYVLRSGVRITGGSVLLAIAFGCLHDLLTAHVSVEYFTVHHPKIIESSSPVALAFVWGILATWWFGLASGVLFTFANRLRHEQLDPKAILRAVGISLASILAISVVVMVVVYALAGMMPVAQRTESFEADRRLVAVAVTHQTSYVLAMVLTLGIAIWIVRSRPAVDVR